MLYLAEGHTLRLAGADEIVLVANSTCIRLSHHVEKDIVPRFGWDIQLNRRELWLYDRLSTGSHLAATVAFHGEIEFIRCLGLESECHGSFSNFTFTLPQEGP